MGCCISKCRPDHDQHSLEYQLNHHVQDKLVISRAPTTPIPHSSSKKISPCPPSPTSSTSSISSFTCTTTSNTLSSTSSFSTASSASLSSKDRSFSNEFLWSCYKENPHIIRINSLRETTHSLMPTKSKAQSRKINPNPSPPAKPCLVPVKQSPPQKLAGSFSMPQKRVRSNSPTNLTRQKSFRKEPERPNSVSNLPSRTLGSPSPSRRFNGDKSGSALSNTITDNSVSKRIIGPKYNAAHCHSVSSSTRKEFVKPTSPNNSSRRLHSGLRHRETCNYRVAGPKIDETVVKEAMSNHHDMDSALNLMEDIGNPLISLDCFIFL